MSRAGGRRARGTEKRAPVSKIDDESAFGEGDVLHSWHSSSLLALLFCEPVDDGAPALTPTASPVPGCCGTTTRASRLPESACGAQLTRSQPRQVQADVRSLFATEV